MRRALCVCAMSWLVGCLGPSSQVTASATITVQGAFQHSDNTPYGNAQVSLIRHPDAIQNAVDTAATTATFGLACLNGSLVQCGPFQVTNTASDGNYQFPTFTGGQTQGTTKEALLFTTFITGPSPVAPAVKAAGIGIDFYIQTDTINVPTESLWDSGNTFSTSGNNAIFSWSNAPADANAFQVIVRTHDENNIIWIQNANGKINNLTFDKRVLQDVSSVWSATAVSIKPGVDTNFVITHYAPAQSLTGLTSVPLSRGKPCYIQSADGPYQPASCPITDGDFNTKLTPTTQPACPSNGSGGDPNCHNPMNNWVYIDLGSNQTVSMLVVYDLMGSFPLQINGPTQQLFVEGSTDGAIYSKIGQTRDMSMYQLVPLNGSSQRYIRLRLSVTDATFSSGGNSEFAIY